MNGTSSSRNTSNTVSCVAPVVGLALGAVTVLTLWLPFGCASFEDLAGRIEQSPSADRCGDCHVEIYQEWQASPHALAFLSEEFLARTDGGTVETCLPCHAPAVLPAELARPTESRRHALEEGVNCLACHRVKSGHSSGPESDGPGATMAGPLGRDALVQPHPIQNLESWFRDAALCGRCHADTHEEWTRASISPRPSCQECHMPIVERKVTQATGAVSKALVAFETVHPLRAHTFSIQPAIEESRRLLESDLFQIESRHRGDSIEISLLNCLPHALPTGAFGTHRIEISVHAQGRVIHTERLNAKRGRSLPAGARHRFTVNWTEETSGLEILVTRIRQGTPERRDVIQLASFEIPGAKRPEHPMHPMVATP